jgi:hypothetical protein
MVIYPIRPTCPAHLFLLNLLILIILGEEYKSLCSSLHSPLLPLVITFLLFRPNILQPGGSYLSFVCGCLFNIFAATLHSWRPSLHPQT